MFVIENSEIRLLQAGDRIPGLVGYDYVECDASIGIIARHWNWRGLPPRGRHLNREYNPRQKSDVSHNLFSCFPASELVFGKRCNDKPGIVTPFHLGGEQNAAFTISGYITRTDGLQEERKQKLPYCALSSLCRSHSMNICSFGLS